MAEITVNVRISPWLSETFKEFIEHIESGEALGVPPSHLLEEFDLFKKLLSHVGDVAELTLQLPNPLEGNNESASRADGAVS